MFKKKNIIIAAVVIVILAVLFIGFKLLVKVGNPKYFYNYLHDAAGSRDVESFKSNTAGADLNRAEATENTDPDKRGVVQHIEVNGTEVASYTRADKIEFTDELLKSISDIQGLVTFRGNYTRTKSFAGAPELTKEKFSEKTWTYNTGKILKSNGVDYWSGNGWTGQPLVIRWSKSTRAVMNMYDTFKDKEGLVEVIYPGMDGNIRFLDMETGEETRPVINVGMTFKGTASLYPDGKTPLLFCGSGDAQTGPFGENVSQRFYIYSLIDGSLLYEGGFNDSFAPRVWHAYDSSPIIDPVTDTLIYPGENGVIYTMKLNTVYDEEAGIINIFPSDMVKFSFDIPDKYKEGGVLWGSECSGAVWNGYLFIGDNGGSVYCLDLNTMKMVWINDVGEDINASPIFETDGGNHYLYIATTLKYGYNANNMGTAAIYKLNAVTGEIIWKKPYEVHTVKGYAGGVLSTGALGSGLVSDWIFYSVSKTPGLEEGYLVALDKYTGEEKWRKSLDMYSWSSTVFFTSENGKNYLIQGCQNGDLLLMDAKTGDTLDKLNFGSGIEATPALYGNRLVLATRSEKIIGVKIE
ncbi:MAG: PQQ-binding-like beta-propeller repeat protein [Lachnospiraceae bacterium]|nr:PQQ-binding-like beta-propeller repeat protein [Lachnospiraceae bacterium]